MVRSMTGFGRAQKTMGGMDITVEIKSVNHRYYEYSSRIPRVYGFQDDRMKAHLQKSISRGKVDVCVWIEMVETSGSEVMVNAPLAQAYVQALEKLCGDFNLRNDISVMSLARMPAQSAGGRGCHLGCGQTGNG